MHPPCSITIFWVTILFVSHSHKNEYTIGVLHGNWVEDRVTFDQKYINCPLDSVSVAKVCRQRVACMEPQQGNVSCHQRLWLSSNPRKHSKRERVPLTLLATFVGLQQPTIKDDGGKINLAPLKTPSHYPVRDSIQTFLGVGWGGSDWNVLPWVSHLSLKGTTTGFTTVSGPE